MTAKKVAMVTGGARRLGKAIALALAEHGFNIALHYHHSVDEAQRTADELRQRGAEVVLVQGDLSVVREVERVVDEAAAAWGRLDVLINSAAIFFRTPLGEVQEEQWDALLTTNLKGPFFCARRAARAMRPTGGVIVNFADTGLDMAWKDYTPYLISKAGIAQMTYGMAKELAPAIRVNAIAPGVVLMQEDATEEQIQRAANSTLLRRIGGAESIVDAVLYLVHAEYVTGVVLPVDGGQRWK
ncbi:MAG TPA: SDR family oxidoreductase [Roseiflexaceae bacterium]|jgi:pteridine reductase|nr:SDR family oxidoreductase [Roseiflexaceae bacterium]